eukprot:2246325-Pyramimonas_sp.AAC.2
MEEKTRKARVPPAHRRTEIVTQISVQEIAGQAGTGPHSGGTTVMTSGAAGAHGMRRKTTGGPTLSRGDRNLETMERRQHGWDSRV